MHRAWAAFATTCHFQSQSLCKAEERPDVDIRKRNMREHAHNISPLPNTKPYLHEQVTICRYK